MEQLNLPSLLPSEGFYLASGTITLDAGRRRLLVIHDQQDNEYKLPRGRKDWAETLEATAVRETLEETGARVSLLPVPLSTRATCPAGAASDTVPRHPLADVARTARYEGGWNDVVVAGTARLIEPVALTLQVYADNHLVAVTSWFVAVGDSTAPLSKSGQTPFENYEARWVSWEEGLGLFANQDYTSLLQRSVELVQMMGPEELACRAEPAMATADGP